MVIIYSEDRTMPRNTYYLKDKTEILNIYNKEKVFVGDNRSIYRTDRPPYKEFVYIYKDNERRIVFDYFKEFGLKILKWFETRQMFD